MQLEQDMDIQEKYNKLSPLQKELIDELIHAMSFDSSSSPFRVINDAMDLYWPTSKRGKEMDRATITSALQAYNKIRSMPDRTE
jgi:hypothetical protein